MVSYIYIAPFRRKHHSRRRSLARNPGTAQITYRLVADISPPTWMQLYLCSCSAGITRATTLHFHTSQTLNSALEGGVWNHRAVLTTKLKLHSEADSCTVNSSDSFVFPCNTILCFLVEHHEPHLQPDSFYENICFKWFLLCVAILGYSEPYWFRRETL